jgi:hypothetical protein
MNIPAPPLVRTFPHGGNQHGGTARIQVTLAKDGVLVSASGDREWVITNDGARQAVNPRSSWQTYKGYKVPNEDEIRYEYKTIDKERVSTGETCLKVIREGGKVVRLEGYFRRTTPDCNIYGSVIMVRK